MIVIWHFDRQSLGGMKRKKDWAGDGKQASKAYFKGVNLGGVLGIEDKIPGWQPYLSQKCEEDETRHYYYPVFGVRSDREVVCSCGGGWTFDQSSFNPLE